MTYPDTSFTISRTNAVRLLKCPLVRDMRDDSRGVVFCSGKSISSDAPSRPATALLSKTEEQGYTYMTSVKANSDATALFDGHRDT